MPDALPPKDVREGPQPNKVDALLREAAAAIGELARTKREEKDLPKFVTSRVVEFFQDLSRSCGKPLEWEKLREFSEAQRNYIQCEVERIRNGADPEAGSKLLLVMLWKRILRFLRGGTLTDEERSLSEKLSEKYNERLVRTVRSRLRAAARGSGASETEVAQSVWLSFMANHLDDVDLSDPDSAWRLLLTIATRHVERHNKRGQRHPQTSTDSTAQSREADELQSLGETLADSSERLPEEEAIYHECLLLFGEYAEYAERVASLEAIGPDLEVAKRLTKRQRDVLALKLADKKRPEIASVLGITVAQVDKTWEEIKRGVA